MPATKRQMGRPSILTAVLRYRPDGSPVTIGDHVVERVTLGQSQRAACRTASIPLATLHGWIVEAARRQAEHAQGKRRLTKSDRDLIDFLERFKRAEDEAEALRLGVIQRAAQGGQQITKTTTKRDAQGNVIETTTVVETMAPQWTAAAWWLERRHWATYARRTPTEDSLPDEALGSPDERAEALASSLRLYLQGAADLRAIDAKAVEVPHDG